jgi:hypothetical protein
MLEISIITQSQGEKECPTYNKKKKRMPNWNGHILCRNGFLKHIIEGKRGGYK